MIPISTALEDTGVASLAADQLLAVAQWTQPWVSLTLILLGVMLLSDVVNNAAATLLMAPIAVGVAQSLGASPDPFLMAVAVGASCAFLTPIGHQSNTLVMGPGGYHFGDYWKVGLPLEVVIAVVAIPMILWIWPLGI
jgi:di/tricarboxylate transporter